MSRRDELGNVLDLDAAYAVTDIDFCRTLKQLGFPQWPWTYYWVRRSGQSSPELHHVISPLLANFLETGSDATLYEVIAAPTLPLLTTLVTSEWEWKGLGSLPDQQLVLSISCEDNLWSAQYHSPSSPSDQYTFGVVTDSFHEALVGLIIIATRTHPSFMTAIRARWSELSLMNDDSTTDEKGGEGK